MAKANRLGEEAQVPPPALPADKETLHRHYMDVQTIFACYGYEEIRWRCTWCAGIGRHVKDKDAPRAADGRFCSEECRDGYAAYESTWENESPLTEVVAVSDEQVKESEQRDNQTHS